MILEAINLDAPSPTARSRIVQRLSRLDKPPLILNTCQRLEVYGPIDIEELPELAISNRWGAAEAFERFSRIAAGLESRVLGELEVLGQVRTAYKAFRQQNNLGDNPLDRIFQDAIALARKARRKSGIDQWMTSLGGIAARDMLDQIPGDEPIAVVGSGSLSATITRYLGKRGSSPIRVSSRCPENAVELALQYGGFGAGLDDLSHLLDGVTGILSATAAPHPVIFLEHIQESNRPLYITDLSVPPDCNQDIPGLPHVLYQGLEQIEAKAQSNVQERRRCAEQAAAIIHDGAIAWSRNT